MSLKKLNLQFLEELDYYLKVEKAQKQITINKSIQRFRKSVKVAIAEGFLEKDPFMLYSSKRRSNTSKGFKPFSFGTFFYAQI